MNIPNTITFARILAVPFAVWLVLNDSLETAFWLFLIAAISDGVDGFIAKRFNMVTQLGSYLDPIADKALLISIYLSLGVEGYIPLWLVIMVVFRDLLIVSGAFFYQAITQNLSMAPLMSSKINTVMQMAYGATALAASAFNWNIIPVLDIASFGVALTTVVSGALYVRIWGKKASEMENDHMKSHTPHDESSKGRL
ncbi:MAG: CDP-alcohol phosphatidyltransferase family protein [Rhodospirillales bacterium]|nr:CDP-alcohol phosphatidyltransferase family protein [Rhodospirillales bacterium]